MKLFLRFCGIAALIVGMVFAGFAVKKSGFGGEISCELQIKDRLVGGVYKSYGIPDCIVPLWLAKVIFRNNTKGRITGLEVQYRLGEYADWCSPHKYPAVESTQTVVDLYNPILSSSIIELTSQAPAELQMKGSYIDGTGKKHDFTESRRLTILGRNEFIFNDLMADERTESFQDWYTLTPLLAAWVSRNDAPVARLASMANKIAGGIGASKNDENCLRVMREIYEIMRTIRITYQYPATLRDKTMSYDMKLVQTLQYPRDTIQKRSGTCIDLAILYAAMLHSVDIEPLLASIPGHVFPVAVSPSGQFIAVESTGVGGGGTNSMNFEEALEVGQKELNEYMENGRLVFTDVRECWTLGVSCPELGELPPDILEKWGIVKLVEGDRAVTGRPAARQPVSSQVGGSTPSRISPGHWVFIETLPGGDTNSGTCQVAVSGSRVQIDSFPTKRFVGVDGFTHELRGAATYTGTINGQKIIATCHNASMAIDGVAMAVPGLPYSFSGTVAADGRMITGTLTNSFGASSNLLLKAQ